MYARKRIKTYLGYTSALRYWRAVGAGWLPEPVANESRAPESCARGIQEVLASRYLDWDIAEEPLHILVASAKDANRTARLVAHICAGEYPPGSFYDVGRELALPSLPLLLSQLAQTEDAITLAELAMEFCGYYSICESSPEGMEYHMPFTCKDKLARGLRELKGRHGASKALAALAYVCDGAASPREAESCLALVAPARMGGAGLPLPHCNHKVEVPDGDARGPRVFYGDLVWPELKLIVEYNGRKYHADAELDQHRRDLLEHAGWKVRVISKRHTASDEAFAGTLAQIARAAGRRFRAQPAATSLLRRRLFLETGQLRAQPLAPDAAADEHAPYPDSWD